MKKFGMRQERDTVRVLAFKKDNHHQPTDNTHPQFFLQPLKKEEWVVEGESARGERESCFIFFLVKNYFKSFFEKFKKKIKFFLFVVV